LTVDTENLNDGSSYDSSSEIKPSHSDHSMLLEDSSIPGLSSGGYESDLSPISRSKKKSRIVMTMDGDISGINAVFKTLNELYKDDNVHWMTMQAMDLARTYMLLKLFLKKGTVTFNTKEIRAQDMPQWLRLLEPWLKHKSKVLVIQYNLNYLIRLP
jgi:hypothetical protein